MPIDPTDLSPDMVRPRSEEPPEVEGKSKHPKIVMRVPLTSQGAQAGLATLMNRPIPSDRISEPESSVHEIPYNKGRPIHDDPPCQDVEAQTSLQHEPPRSGSPMNVDEEPSPSPIMTVVDMILAEDENPLR